VLAYKKLVGLASAFARPRDCGLPLTLEGVSMFLEFVTSSLDAQYQGY